MSPWVEVQRNVLVMAMKKVSKHANKQPGTASTGREGSRPLRSDQICPWTEMVALAIGRCQSHTGKCGDRTVSG